MFKLGQKVVCIDDSRNPETEAYTPCHPIKGQVYTIRGVHKQPNIPGYGVYLEELLNPIQMWSDSDEMEWPFKSERFRPVVESLLRPAIKISVPA